MAEASPGGMYPIIRLTKEFLKARRMPPIGVFDTHVSNHICWPWDIDMFLELNNGRTLTVFDLGRLPMAHRVGLTRVLRQKRWGLTMAGVSVRWRVRVRPFQKFEMRTRAIGWDDRFVYLEQSMWLPDGRCANHALYRSAVTDRDGIVAPTQIMKAMGLTDPSPTLPDWVRAWAAADATRPWPPMTATE